MDYIEMVTLATLKPKDMLYGSITTLHPIWIWIWSTLSLQERSDIYLVIFLNKLDMPKWLLSNGHSF